MSTPASSVRTASSSIPPVVFFVYSRRCEVYVTELRPHVQRILGVFSSPLAANAFALQHCRRTEGDPCSEVRETKGGLLRVRGVDDGRNEETGQLLRTDVFVKAKKVRAEADELSEEQYRAELTSLQQSKGATEEEKGEGQRKAKSGRGKSGGQKRKRGGSEDVDVEPHLHPRSSAPLRRPLYFVYQLGLQTSTYKRKAQVNTSNQRVVAVFTSPHAANCLALRFARDRMNLYGELPELRDPIECRWVREEEGGLLTLHVYVGSGSHELVSVLAVDVQEEEGGAMGEAEYRAEMETMRAASAAKWSQMPSGFYDDEVVSDSEWHEEDDKSAGEVHEDG